MTLAAAERQIRLIMTVWIASAAEGVAFDGMKVVKMTTTKMMIPTAKGARR